MSFFLGGGGAGKSRSGRISDRRGDKEGVLEVTQSQVCEVLQPGEALARREIVARVVAKYPDSNPQSLAVNVTDALRSGRLERAGRTQNVPCALLYTLAGTRSGEAARPAPASGWSEIFKMVKVRGLTEWVAAVPPGGETAAKVAGKLGIFPPSQSDLVWLSNRDIIGKLGKNESGRVIWGRGPYWPACVAATGKRPASDR